MWLGRLRMSTALYFVTRYFPVAKLLFSVAVRSSNPPHCTAIYRSVEFLGVIARSGIIVTLIARTYAICSQNQAILVGLGIIGSGAVVLGFVEVFQTSCIPASQTFHTNAVWGIIVSSTRLALEATVILLTFFRTRSAFRLLDPRAMDLFAKESLSVFVLRSGVLYFIATFFLELLAILFNSAAPKWLNGVTNALPLPIPAILISRFLLELRGMVAHTTRTTTGTTLLPHVSFAKFQTRLVDDFGGTTLHQPADEEFPLENRDSHRQEEADAHSYGSL